MVTNSLLNLKDKVVIITGGYGYLGKEITRGLSAYGANVFVLARDAKKFAATFDQSETNITFLEGDVGSSDSINRSITYVQNEHQKIDVLINNAYYSKGISPETMTDDEWETGIDGTLGNVFRCIRSIIPIMKKQKQGKIINVSSMYGMVAPDFSVYDVAPSSLNPPHYGAAKAGVLQLTRYYASYLGHYGINVNCVSPGPFPSDEVQKNEKFMAKLASKTLLGRIGKPEELAGAFVLLASDAGNYITGQNIVVDGGWTVR